MKISKQEYFLLFMSLTWSSIIFSPFSYRNRLIKYIAFRALFFVLVVIQYFTIQLSPFLIYNFCFTNQNDHNMKQEKMNNTCDIIRSNCFLFFFLFFFK